MEAELKSVPSAAARTMTVTDDMMVRPSTVKYFILFVLESDFNLGPGSTYLTASL